MKRNMIKTFKKHKRL